MGRGAVHRKRAAAYGRWLWFLLILFCSRVGGQLLQSFQPVAFLPPFEEWQGSRLPYPVLVGSQLLIMGVAGWVALCFSRGRVAPRRLLGGRLLIVGAVYFGVMAVRLLLGLTVLAGHAWFARSIPAFFHVVLACFVLLVGHYHWRYGQRGG